MQSGDTINFLLFFFSSLFFTIFRFSLDFLSPRVYNIGSENEEMRNRYGDCI